MPFSPEAVTPGLTPSGSPLLDTGLRLGQQQFLTRQSNHHQQSKKYLGKNEFAYTLHKYIPHRICVIREQSVICIPFLSLSEYDYSLQIKGN